MALKRDPADPSPEELDQLVGVGNELVDAVVLGNRIRSNGRTNNAPQTSSAPSEESTQSGQLAFTGADVTAFVALSMLLLMVGTLLVRRRGSSGIAIA